MKKTFRYIIGSALATSALLLTGCSLDEDNPHAGDATLNNFAAWSGMQETTYFPLVENLFSRSDYFMMAETGTDMWVCAGNGDNTKQAIYYEEPQPGHQRRQAAVEAGLPDHLDLQHHHQRGRQPL